MRLHCAVILAVWISHCQAGIGIPHRPQIVAKNGGIFIDGQPFAPNGYCSHAHLQGGGGAAAAAAGGRGDRAHTRSYEIEVTEGLNAVFAYRGWGEGEGRWGNESWPDTLAFLDRAAAVGLSSRNSMSRPL